MKYIHLLMQTKKLYAVTGIVSFFFLISLAYFTSGHLFQASITEGSATNTNADIYISDSYTGNISDKGSFQVKTGTGLSNVVAVTFNIKYNPAQIQFSDSFTLGTLTDSSNNAFSPKMQQVSPDNTKGIITVTIADDTPFSLARGQTLVRLTGNLADTLKDQDTVALSISDAQLIDNLYNIKNPSTSNGKLTILTSYTVGLKVLNAESISSTQIALYFDDYLKSASSMQVKLTNVIDDRESFDTVSAVAMSTSASIAANDGKKVILTVSPALTAGTNYKVLIGVGPQGNTKSTLDQEHTISYFTTAGSSLGTNNLNSVTVNDKNTFTATFSGSLSSTDASNPTKYKLFRSMGVEQVISTAQASGNNVRFTVPNALISGAKYYLISYAVAETSEKRVSYFVPSFQDDASILTIAPESVPSTGGTFTITGTHLANISTVSINGTALTIGTRSDTSLQVTVPATGLTSGVYDVSFQSSTGALIVKPQFLAISGTDLNMKILSTESYASPQRVPNDGKTKTKLWVLITNPTGTSTINKVNLDLRPINGDAVASMIGVDSSGQQIIVDNKRWFWLETVVPSTVKTSETAPITLNVTAEDTKGNKALGTVSLTVTNNVLQSDPPTIMQAYSSPQAIEPAGKFGFYAYVSDNNGISTIDSVVADLGVIGLGPVSLKSADSITQANTSTSNTLSSSGGNSTTTGNTTVSSTNANTNTASTSNTNTASTTTSTAAKQRTSQWYGIQDLTLPRNIASGSYTVNITASDNSGATGKYTTTLVIGSAHLPEIDKGRTKVSPASQIIKDGQTKFTFSTYVSHVDGLDQITSVYLDIREIGGTTVPLNLQGTLTSGQKGGWYEVKDLTIAPETVAGQRTLIVYATDKAGHEVAQSIIVEATNANEVGDAPIIDSARSYTSPAAVLPDETTKVTLNAFIEKHDYPISQVIVDLSNIGKFTGTQSVSTADSATSCLGATERMACMKAGLQEGNAGQWYTLSDVVVLKSVASSMQPYQIPVTAVDNKGKTGYGYIYLNVSDGTLPTEQVGFPKVQMAISTSGSTVEVLFSNPINPKTVISDNFKITDATNTQDTLGILSASINPGATVVTLTTKDQKEGRNYTVIANSKKLGLKESQYSDNHANFIGYNKAKIPPQLTKVTAISSTQIIAMFSEGLRPSSVMSDAVNSFQIFTVEAQPKRLTVKHVELSDDNKTVRISTDTQKSEQAYILRVNNILSAAGVPVGGDTKPASTANTDYYGIHKQFIGFKAVSVDTKTLFDRGDFNGDGKVDFTDFTMFSALYGKTLDTVNPVTPSTTHSNTNTSNTPQSETSQNNPPTTTQNNTTTLPATSPVNESTHASANTQNTSSTTTSGSTSTTKK